MGHATSLRKKQIEYVSQQAATVKYGVNGWVQDGRARGQQIKFFSGGQWIKFF